MQLGTVRGSILLREYYKNRPHVLQRALLQSLAAMRIYLQG